MAIFGDFISGLLEFVYIVAILYVVGAIFVIIKNHLFTPLYEGAVKTGQKLVRQKDQTQAEAAATDARVQELQRQLKLALADSQAQEEIRRQLEQLYDREKQGLEAAKGNIDQLKARLEQAETQLEQATTEKEVLITEREEKEREAMDKLAIAQQERDEAKKRAVDLQKELDEEVKRGRLSEDEKDQFRKEIEEANAKAQQADEDMKAVASAASQVRMLLDSKIAEAERREEIAQRQKDAIKVRLNEFTRLTSERIKDLQQQVNTASQESQAQTQERERLQLELEEGKKHQEELAQEIKELKEKILENEDNTKEIIEKETGDVRRLLGSLRRPIYSSIRASKKAIKAVDDAIQYAQEEKYNKMDEELMLVNLRMNDIQDQDQYINDLSNKIQQLNKDVGESRPEISAKIKSLQNLLIKEIDNVRTETARALAQNASITPPANKGAFLSILASAKTSLEHIQEQLNGLHAELKEETS